MSATSIREEIISGIFVVVVFVIAPVSFVGCVMYDIYTDYKHPKPPKPCSYYGGHTIDTVPARCIKEFYPAQGKLPCDVP